MTIIKEDGAGGREFPASRCRDRTRLVSELRNALRTGDGLYLVYQPQVSFLTGSVTGAEALIRWEHPRTGLIMPDGIIPLAEGGGLRAELTRWVIESALSTVQEWQRKGIALLVSVNVSAKDVAHAGFCGALEGQIFRYAVSPSLFGLECLETESFLTTPGAIPALERLKRRGITVSLDDFGVGYSEVACLTSLPLDVVKLDRSVVAAVSGSRECRDRLQHTIRVIKSHGYRVIAEGVENSAMLPVLRDMGCDAAQGYVYSAPLRPENFVRWLSG
ncbi:EAL domain-containing protein [Erwinia aphidicola]|uniref:EAL domain-containing protein n=1 Tax=Erwinia aphidicola TaxID=68334 RepID=UPI00301988FB